MSLLSGIAAFALAIAMTWVARARNGQTVPYLRNELIGQFYGMSILSLASAGLVLMVSGWLR